MIQSLRRQFSVFLIRIQFNNNRFWCDEIAIIHRASWTNLIRKTIWGTLRLLTVMFHAFVRQSVRIADMCWEKRRRSIRESIRRTLFLYVFDHRKLPIFCIISTSYRTMPFHADITQTHHKFEYSKIDWGESDHFKNCSYSIDRIIDDIEATQYRVTVQYTHIWKFEKADGESLRCAHLKCLHSYRISVK